MTRINKFTWHLLLMVPLVLFLAFGYVAFFVDDSELLLRAVELVWVVVGSWVSGRWLSSRYFEAIDDNFYIG